MLTARADLLFSKSRSVQGSSSSLSLHKNPYSEMKLMHTLLLRRFIKSWGVFLLFFLICCLNSECLSLLPNKRCGTEIYFISVDVPPMETAQKCVLQERSPDTKVSQPRQSAGQAQPLKDLKQTTCIPMPAFLPSVPSQSWAGIEVFVFEILQKQLNLI